MYICICNSVNTTQYLTDDDAVLLCGTQCGRCLEYIHSDAQLLARFIHCVNLSQAEQEKK